jgi:hypothetical protein
MVFLPFLGRSVQNNRLLGQLILNTGGKPVPQVFVLLHRLRIRLGMGRNKVDLQTVANIFKLQRIIDHADLHSEDIQHITGLKERRFDPLAVEVEPVSAVQIFYSNGSVCDTQLKMPAGHKRKANGNIVALCSADLQHAVMGQYQPIRCNTGPAADEYTCSGCLVDPDNASQRNGFLPGLEGEAGLHSDSLTRNTDAQLFFGHIPNLQSVFFSGTEGNLLSVSYIPAIKMFVIAQGESEHKQILLIYVCLMYKCGFEADLRSIFTQIRMECYTVYLYLIIL